MYELCVDRYSLESSVNSVKVTYELLVQIHRCPEPTLQGAALEVLFRSVTDLTMHYSPLSTSSTSLALLLRFCCLDVIIVCEPEDEDAVVSV
jgi:hypothetical protein